MKKREKKDKKDKKERKREKRDKKDKVGALVVSGVCTTPACLDGAHPGLTSPR
jgi:hypothetical protein